MADFEDNNPFAGGDTRSEVSSEALHYSIHNENNNPNDDPEDGDSFNDLGGEGDDDDDDVDDGDSHSGPGEDESTSGGPESRQHSRSYASRVEQLLAENPKVQITIVNAGKSHEGNSRGFIAYTIKIHDLTVRRRYSEFESLRTTLTKLFPTLIVPPIPEKHSMSDYAVSPTKAKEDSGIIEHRHRMLAVFLNRCCHMKRIRNSSVFQRFLDPNSSWSEVLNSPPVSNLPKNILKAPPLDPSSPTAAHAYLPIPSSSAKLATGGSGSSGIAALTGRRSSLDESDIHSASSHNDGQSAAGTAAISTEAAGETSATATFDEVEQNAKEYETVIVGGLEKVNRRIIKRYSDIASDYSELGAKFNAFSLEESGPLARAVEKVGQAVDDSYMAMEALVNSLSSSFSEPLGESAQFAAVVRSVLKYRRQKSLQHELTADSLASKRNTLATLERSEHEAQRINHYLHGDNDVNSNGNESDASFPPTHEPSSVPSSASTKPKKASSAFKFPGLNNLNQAIHGIIDVDPETTRRNNIGKTREQISQLEEALVVAKSDAVLANESVREELERFQKTKEEDLRRIMNAYLQCHIEWAKKNLESWQECRQEVDKL
ncbi:Atg20p [Sugiyamaella lignohabitans]|uniref:Atg20p n=1 Tax=Sugiyamaella lignohabitans TaxID=796027 RepID=A0A167DDI7_9ASCO|nr:Atg20p [Sugiyamaella lignohabitans]ANB12792.1 Atg20p [Sugiyamaella lignohabitans]